MILSVPHITDLKHQTRIINPQLTIRDMCLLLPSRQVEETKWHNSVFPRRYDVPEGIRLPSKCGFFWASYLKKTRKKRRREEDMNLRLTVAVKSVILCYNILFQEYEYSEFILMVQKSIHIILFNIYNLTATLCRC